MKSTYKTLGIILLVLIGIVFLLAKEKTSLSPSSSSQKSQAQTILSFSPNPIVTIIDEGSGHISIDAGENRLNLIQIKFSYDPKLIYNLTMKKTPEFSKANVLNNFVDEKNGTATFILHYPKNEKGFQGKGNVLSFTFKTYLHRGEKTNITFMKETMVADTISSSLLKETIDTQIIRKRR